MTKHKFILPNCKTLTSIVMDVDEFSELCDAIDNTGLVNTSSMREAGLVPMIVYGSKTSPIFEKYGIDSDCISAIIRGTGDAILAKFIQPYGNA